MNYSLLLEQTEAFVRSADHGKHFEERPFHNLKHTEHVVANASVMAWYYRLVRRDFFTVVAAAWFHDYGYLSGAAANHGERGAEVSAGFLRDLKVDEDTITAIARCILATRMPQTPGNLMEEILCDADLYHLGTDDFSEFNKLLRKEREEMLGIKIDKNEWCLKNIAFLESHHYHTNYCRDLLEGKKQENLEKLKKRAELTLSNVVAASPAPESGKKAQTAIEEPKIKKPKDGRPDKGIETMFRISSGNHQRLSDMADNKANIMITTNSIIISVLLSILLRKLEDDSYLIIPTLILLTVCITTMVFSILATRPSVPNGTFTRQDLDDKKVNLLFFGSFYRMNFKDYASGMQEMMNDRDFLYGSLTKDVYAQGVVLGKKYRLLRTGYNVFMFGIVSAVIAFVVSSMFFRS